MYGIYIIAIVLAGLAVTFGIASLIEYVLTKRYKVKFDEATEKYMAFRWADTEKKTLEKEYKLYSNKFYKTDASVKPLFVTFVTLAIITVLFAFGGGMSLKGAEREYAEFVATQEVFEQVYEAENELENIKLTEDLITMNQWLVQAKASKQTYGIFSRYYDLDVENLQPIGKRDREDKQ